MRRVHELDFAGIDTQVLSETGSDDTACKDVPVAVARLAELSPFGGFPGRQRLFESREGIPVRSQIRLPDVG